MKLVDKFTWWFIGVILLTTPVTVFIGYSNIEKNIAKTETARLKELNEMTANRLRRGERVTDELTKGFSTEIVRLTTGLPVDKVQVVKTNAHTSRLKGQVSLLAVNSYFTISNVNYRISSYNDIPSSKQILYSILDTVLWKLLLIIICVGVTVRLVSQRILSSLRHTMKMVQGFNLKQKIQFSRTSTREFRELNSFLQKMTDKAVDEYVAMKEFSENASHELQTPLAILRNKLELLSETNISADQAELLSDMQNAIEKLSKINRSLTLLAKLENNEYAVSENIRFCKIAKDVLAAYEDRIEIKNLSVKTDIDKNILLKIHPVLADMLMNNLLGNAIRHNIQNGHIEIALTQRRLVVRNTGLPPEMPTDELFQRFKKSNQCSESVGLGLAIVKQICEVSGFFISYNYSNPLHILQVDFQPAAKAEEMRTPAPQAPHDNFEPAVL